MLRYWILIGFIIGVTLGLLIPTSPAHSQSVCGERSTIIKHLKKTYQEVPTHIALAADGQVLEVFISPSGTWTIIMTKPGGRSCGMLIGEAWEDVPPNLGPGI